jgi:hypothetical protein
MQEVLVEPDLDLTVLHLELTVMSRNIGYLYLSFTGLPALSLIIGFSISQ